jgi:hypothetical protein
MHALCSVSVHVKNLRSIIIVKEKKIKKIFCPESNVLFIPLSCIGKLGCDTMDFDLYVFDNPPEYGLFDTPVKDGLPVKIALDQICPCPCMGRVESTPSFHPNFPA